MTPILSRPSIAATISRSSSVHESDTTLSPAEEIDEMQRDDTPPFPSVEPQPALPEDKPDANQTLPSSQRLIPTPPPPYQNQTLQNNSSATPQPSSQKSTSSSSASVSKERGEEGEIYEVHVQKGLRGLGIKVATNESGMVIVKSLASSSPITKDGTMRFD